MRREQLAFTSYPVTRSVRRVALCRTLLCAMLFLAVFAVQVSGQNPSKPEPNDDVIRVKAELVQTDVTVVDKRGQFVDGLKAEQFVLRVDTRSQPLAFFEQVAAGSSAEERQLAAARLANKPSVSRDTKSNTGPDRGRLIFFFVDDIHLTGESLTRARSLLSHFVADKMAVNDRVAIVTTSGQIGFLQQLTDNKAVLSEAINRLNYKYNPETIASGVRISEVDANLVASRGFNGLFAYLVEATMKEMQMQDPLGAIMLVKNRVRQINSQSKLAEIETLSRLAGLIRSTGSLAGRKVVFFISDGFVMDTKRSSGRDVMQSLAGEAARVGAVVYTLDTRSNVFGAGADASSNEYPDFGPRTAGRSLAESKAPQEPLETLADETGGRSYLNSNTLDDALAEALRDSSAYYLLAWRPDSESQKAGKSRIDVVIKDRPDLRVRMRRHYFDFRPNQTKTVGRDVAASANTSPEDDLRAALGSLYPRRDVPVSLSAGYLNTLDQAPLLSITMQIDTEMLSFEGPEGKQEATVDVLGVALDDRGSFSSFKQKLNVPRTVSNAQRFVIWNQSLPLPPGLYQVRVAVRDSQTGCTGGAIEWIEVPRLEPDRFSMSSLFLTERLVESGPGVPVSTASPRSRAAVEHRFAQTSSLHFQTYVYNAARNEGVSDIWISAEVFRGSQQVLATAPIKISAAVADTWRSPFASDIALKELPLGTYTLVITATDKVRGIAVSQRVAFAIE